MFFPGLEFQPPSASLDLIHFPFDTVWILRVEVLHRFVVVSFIFLLMKFLFSMPPLRVSFLLKLVVRPDLETIASHDFQQGIKC